MQFDQLGRREVITLLGGAAVSCISWPLPARAQQGERTRRIGLMGNLPLRPIERFRKALQELGYVENRNLVIEYRFAEGRDERYPAFAAELVARPVDLIVTWGTRAAFAAKQATATIPIVLGAIGDAVNTGLVPNLARPGGNITGFVALNVDLEEKRLELLKELLPHLSRVAVLGNSLNPLNRINLDTARRVAQRLAVRIDAFEVRSSQDIGGALRAIAAARPEAVLLASDTQLLSERKQIADAMATRSHYGTDL
jgi:putative ABC transport system substrate-binding protein